jgi:sarcosine oxidase gamma subunit
VDAAPGSRTATLRYFEPDGPFAAAVRAATGAALPGPLGAALARGAALSSGAAGEGPLILAWRSPTETLALTDDAARHTRLAAALAPAAGGCFVDLTGGLRVLRLRGERSADLLARLGSDALIPRLNESRPGRLAEVAAVALCVRPGETLLAVDRAYAAYLLDWIRATLADWPGG